MDASPLVWEPHLDLICAHYEAVARFDCLELVANVPPGTGKSKFTNVLWPCWVWGPFGFPSARFMFTSYSHALTKLDGQKCANLLNSEWYQRRWGHLAHPDDLARYKGHDGRPLHPVGAVTNDRKARADGSAKVAAGLFFTSAGGLRLATMFNGQATGHHVNYLVADDPTKPQDIQQGGERAAEVLEQVWWRWQNVFLNRRADPSRFARICIMQRLHEVDLAGKMVAQGATHLCLPMEYDPARACVTPWGEDWRNEPGELLAPKRFPREVVAEYKGEALNDDGSRKAGMAPSDYQAQMQQDPTPSTGALFTPECMAHRFIEYPVRLPMLISVDASFKEGDEHDNCGLQVWGKDGHRFLCFEDATGHYDLLGLCEAILALRKRWPNARRVLIEGKANGPAAIQVLKKKLPGIAEVTPLGGKVARANAVLPYFLAGNVLYREGMANYADLVAEHVKFPRGARDDRVDVATQAILDLDSETLSTVQRAMQRVREVYG